MRTYFATPERASAETLEQQIRTISKHPLFDGLIQAVNGVFAVCNEHRQILAVNDKLLNLLGVEDPSSLLGLRPGEALSCVYAHKCESGCGTSEFCSNCGAAIALVTSLEKNHTVEKNCSISVNSIREKEDFHFIVRSTPLQIEEEKFLIVTMQDITRLQKLQCLERVFIHDIVNLATAISGLSDFAKDCEPDDLPLLFKAISNTTTRLFGEVKLQRVLASDKPENYIPKQDQITLKEIFEETIDSISGHVATKNRKLRKPEIVPEKSFHTDKTLLLKVLQNMLINAFENSDEGRAVRFWVDCGKKDLTFCVWNHRVIPLAMHGRIFQRNYTTKIENGHGLGTYSMKIFGEGFLGGKISFASSEDKGTVFRFNMPLRSADMDKF